jgi:putative tryptophan/tyrosine transport system substrate-binding protein
MRRREFIAGVASAAAWLIAARAQQPIPTVGYLHGGSANPATAPAFRKGLADIGFVEGTNVAVVYRWAEDHYDRLPSLAAELVRLLCLQLVRASFPNYY